MEDILAVILAGGMGSRLYPLTRDRAKPYVPWGGSYRVIDFTLSIPVGYNVKKTLILTQYKPMDLEKHINQNWSRYMGLSQEITIASPEQTMTTQNWFEGTADALLQYKGYIERHCKGKVLVLSGDHILPPKRFRLDHMIDFHNRKEAALTIIAKKYPITENYFEGEGENRHYPFGVIQMNEDSRVLDFTEKPKVPATIPGDKDHALASMGIYIFEKDTLLKFLKGNFDFGKKLIPEMLKSGRDIRVYSYDDYWEDIGTRRAYYESQMGLLLPTPTLDLHELSLSGSVEEIDPLTKRKVIKDLVQLRNAGGSYPPSRVRVGDSYMIVSGSKAEGNIRNSIIRNSSIDENSNLEGTIVMKSRLKNCNIKRTIVDHNNDLEGITIDPESLDYENMEFDEKTGLFIEYLSSGLPYYIDPKSKIAIVPRQSI